MDSHSQTFTSFLDKHKGRENVYASYATSSIHHHMPIHRARNLYFSFTLVYLANLHLKQDTSESRVSNPTVTVLRLISYIKF